MPYYPIDSYYRNSGGYGYGQVYGYGAGFGSIHDGWVPKCCSPYGPSFCTPGGQYYSMYSYYSRY